MPPDKGCKFAISCLDCPYLDGQVTVKFKAKCVDDYVHGSVGLAGELRASLIQSRFKERFDSAILAKTFNITVDWTKRIARGRNR